MISFVRLLVAFAAVVSTVSATPRAKVGSGPCRLSKNRDMIISSRTQSRFARAGGYASECTLSLPRGGVVITDAGAPEQDTTLAGKFMPFLSNFPTSSKEWVAIYEALRRAIDEREFVVFALLAWASMPLLKFLHSATTKEKDAKTEKKFADSYLYNLVENISQAAMVGVFIYAVDCLAVVLDTMGFKYLHKVRFSNKAANVSFFVWIAMRIMYFKEIIIYRSFRNPNEQGRASLYNSIMNVLLWIATIVVLVDRLNINFGVTLKSFFAFGGVGTLVLSLASRDLAAQLVNGIAVSTSERFFVGDEVKLGDGTAGFISKIGLIYTEIRGYDEIIVKMPNSEIAHQRTSNISRMEKCRVTQTLRFNYEDLEKMPAVVASIKEEIAKACPSLITDGSRPFRAHWREYQEDHLQVVVDCRFNLPPTGNVYWDNKQEVLEAIARGTAKHNVKFALPSSVSKNLDLDKMASSEKHMTSRKK